MDNQQKIYFEKLSESRKESAKALESFALKGVKKSVVEKYSDQAHFIYELLQNADDALATTASFVLFKDKLVFTHNGSRPFTVSDPSNEENDQKTGGLGDINAITAVAASNKTDGATIENSALALKPFFNILPPHISMTQIFFSKLNILLFQHY